MVSLSYTTPWGVETGFRAGCRESAHHPNLIWASRPYRTVCVPYPFFLCSSLDSPNMAEAPDTPLDFREGMVGARRRAAELAELGTQIRHFRNGHARIVGHHHGSSVREDAFQLFNGRFFLIAIHFADSLFEPSTTDGPVKTPSGAFPVSRVRARPRRVLSQGLNQQTLRTRPYCSCSVSHRARTGLRQNLEKAPPPAISDRPTFRQNTAKDRISPAG